MATHHIIPVNLGGTNEYENIVIIQEQVHILIHNSKSLQEALKNFTNEYSVNEKTKKKFIDIYKKANPEKK